MKGLILTVLLFTLGLCNAQESSILLSKLKTTSSDTQRINTLNALTKIYLDSNLDSAILFNKLSISIGLQTGNEKFSYKGLAYKAQFLRKKKNLDSAMIMANTAYNIAKKYNNLNNVANAYNVFGTIYEQLNQSAKAKENYQNALKISSAIKDKKEMLSSYLHLGIYCKKTEDITNALKYLLEAIKISEEINDSSSMFTININLGSIYERTKDNKKAFECYRKALKINETDKDENDRAICYYKLGKLFHRERQIDSAKKYLMATLKIHEKRHDEEGLIMDYANIGGFSYEEKDFVNAEKNYAKAIELAIKFKDSVRLNTLYSSMGMLAEKQNKLDEAIKQFNIGLRYINQKVSRETIMQYYKRISEVYVRQKKYQDALQAYTLYKAWSDSAFNVNEAKKQTELKLNYEFEQTQKKIEAENKAKELISQAELEQERKQRNLLLIGLAIISLMLIITVKNYRAKQKANTILHKQKLEIERQKKIVEEKNHEISDSINYALRIQTASIPKVSELDTFFKNYDLFFKPKDVVSGDFYWAEKTSDFSLLAVGDCTGHGVPGAITSMIGSMLLNEIFNVKKIYQPNEVLTELNRLVKLTLRQDSSSITNDGMDIAFCMINYQTYELLYSGANRPLYIISNGEIKEYKPTKMSIGGQVALIQSYDLHKIELNKGDTIILSTDGYADQFGGEKEKKFTTKAFRNLLAQHQHLHPKELKQIIESNYNNWKGNYEQTDDILVFILKV